MATQMIGVAPKARDAVGGIFFVGLVGRMSCSTRRRVGTIPHLDFAFRLDNPTSCRALAMR